MARVRMMMNNDNGMSYKEDNGMLYRKKIILEKKGNEFQDTAVVSGLDEEQINTYSVETKSIVEFFNNYIKVNNLLYEPLDKFILEDFENYLISNMNKRFPFLKEIVVCDNTYPDMPYCKLIDVNYQKFGTITTTSVRCSFNANY